MKYLSRILLITFVFVFSATYSHADSWRDKTELLIYSPRYFGPNAFPIPEMRDGRVSERYEVEVRANTIIIRVTRPGTSWGVPCCPSSGGARESK